MTMRTMFVFFFVALSTAATGCDLKQEESPVGHIQAEIRGGTEVPVGQYEAVVRVGTSSGGMGGNCSGTLISPTAVLTAAHCVCSYPGSAGPDYPLQIHNCQTRRWVTFDNVRLTSDTSIRMNVPFQGDVRVHPGYPTEWELVNQVKPWNSNDYALIILDVPPRDRVLVNPIQVASPSKRAQLGDAITLVGYGKSSDANVSCSSGPNVEPYGTKHQVTVEFQEYLEYDDPAAGEIMAWSNSPGAGSCPGDSGGPALGGGRVMGVSSTGNSATNFSYDATFSAYSWLSQNACPIFDQRHPHVTFCTEMCPCATGEGDCDVLKDCSAGLVCERDLGYQVGLPGNYDVCEPPSEMVSIYRDTWLSGAQQRLPVGTYRATDLYAVGNDALSSLSVPPGMVAEVCTDRPGIGECRDYSSIVLRLDSTMNDRASYIRVTPAVTVYEGRYFSGIKSTLSIGIYENPDLTPVRNDTISSLIVGPGVSALLCSDRPGIGICRQYAGDVSLIESDMEDRTSYIDIRPAVTVYRGKGFTGITESMPIGTYEHTDFSKVGNDTISSLIVAPGLSAYVCSDRPGIGTCRAFDGSVADIGDLDNTASYIDVRPAVTVYTGIDFRGKRQSLTRGIHLHTDFSTVGNDTITSLIVPPGLLAYVCSDRPGIGDCRIYFGEVGYVGSIIDNRASYIQVL